MLLYVDQQYKVSISEWHNNVRDTAGVLAHELGHALGMEHDFDGDISCHDINGLMDYGERKDVDKFTTCSRQDFRDFYNRMFQFYNGHFCLDRSKSIHF